MKDGEEQEALYNLKQASKYKLSFHESPECLALLKDAEFLELVKKQERLSAQLKERH
jgi:hypothetical protein